MHVTYALIKENLRNRKIMVMERNPKIEAELKEIFGEENVLNSDGICNINNMEYLVGRTDELFVFFPNIYQSQDITLKLASFGYKEKNDVLWFHHKMFTGASSEFYGNEVELKSNIKLKVNGWGNKIKIGKNVSFPQEMIIGSNANINIGDNVEIKSGWFGELHDCELNIGNGCSFGVNTNIWVLANAKLNIGDNCEFGNDLILRPHCGTSIIIEDDCLFSWNCIVLGGDGHGIYDVNTGDMLNNPQNKNENVLVKKHVWVSGEVAILGGTVIGENSICGYRSLLKKKYPNNVCIAGSPAKVIKKDVTWSRNFKPIDYEQEKINNEIFKRTEVFENL